MVWVFVVEEKFVFGGQFCDDDNNDIRNGFILCSMDQSCSVSSNVVLETSSLAFELFRLISDAQHHERQFNVVDCLLKSEPRRLELGANLLAIGVQYIDLVK